MTQVLTAPYFIHSLIAQEEISREFYTLGNVFFFFCPLHVTEMKQLHSSQATWTLFPDIYRHLEGMLGKRSFHMDRCGVTGAFFYESNSHPRLELKPGKDNMNVQKERLLILFRAEEQLNKAAAILIRKKESLPLHSKGN